MSKPLKALEENHNYMCSLCKEDCFLGCKFGKNYIAIEKALKALEIIVNKEINMYMVIWYCKTHNYKDYKKDYEKLDFDMPALGEELLTKEEFDLLKEVIGSNKTDEDLINNTFGLD